MQREYRLSETTLSQIVATLENAYHQEQITALQNAYHQEQITALQNEAEKREGWVGYYIKTTTNKRGVSKSKEDHINITVMLNRQGDLQVVVKPEGEREKEVTYNEGTIKRATNETMIFFDQEGTLRVNNVVDIKDKQAVGGKLDKNIQISKEVIGSDSKAFTCFFPDAGVVQGGTKRAGDIRIYQTHKGGDIIDYIDKKNTVDVDYAMQYMLQIGAQLSHLHEKGISHHDVKLENMLSREVDGHHVFTLIDCPLQGETAPPSMSSQNEFATTPGASCPPLFMQGIYYWSNDVYYKGQEKEKDAIDEIWITQRVDQTRVAKSYWESSKAHTGHVDDSYAYLRGLYKIADSIPDRILGRPNPSKCLLQKFALAQMQELADQTLAYVQNDSQNSWPEENLTVAKIQKAFAEYCEKNSSLQAAFNQAEVTAKQAGSGAVAGLVIPTKEPRSDRGVTTVAGGRRRPTNHRKTKRKAAAVADTNKTQPAVTVAMVLKEERNINSFRWLWLLFLDCATGRLGEGSRRTLYENMYSQFSLKDKPQERLDFGWELIAQSLENKRFETGCVEFAQALIVAEVLYSTEGGEIKESDIASTISTKVSGLTESNIGSFTSKLNSEESIRMILSVVQTIKNPQQAAPSQAMQSLARTKTAAEENVLNITKEANVVQLLKAARSRKID